MSGTPIGLGAESAYISCLCLTVQLGFSELRTIAEILAVGIALIEFSPGHLWSPHQHVTILPG